MDLSRIAQLIREHGFAQHAEILLGTVRPSIWVKETVVEATAIRSVCSYLAGGIAFLPEATEWPMAGDRPMDHLATIRLSDVAPFDVEKALPPSGLLMFWYDQQRQPMGFDPEHRTGFKVTYIEDESAKLKRR